MAASKGSRATRLASISARMSRSESSTAAPYRVSPGRRPVPRRSRDNEVMPTGSGPYVAVVGPSAPDDDNLLAQARTAGRLLAERGCVVLTGGLGGVMAAAAAGVAEAGGTAGGPPARGGPAAAPAGAARAPPNRIGGM